jgi:hypothetical protein
MYRTCGGTTDRLICVNAYVYEYSLSDGTPDRLICVNAYVYVCSLSDHSDGRWSHRDTPCGRATSLPVVALRHSRWSRYVTPPRFRWSRYVTPGGRATSLPVVALRPHPASDGRATPHPTLTPIPYGHATPHSHHKVQIYRNQSVMATTWPCQPFWWAVPTVLVGRVFLIFLFPSPTLKGLPSI